MSNRSCTRRNERLNISESHLRAVHGLVLAAIIFWSLPASAQESLEHTVRLTPGQPLQGGIKHSEHLPGVEPQLKIGAVFKDDLLPKLEPANEWFVIPKWFAGNWSTTSKTVTEVINYRSGAHLRPDAVIVNKWQGSRGFQRDRTGAIWEYKNVPFVERVESDDTLDIKIITEYDPLEVSQNLVLRRKLLKSVSVDRLTKRITRILQLETVQKSYPVAGNLIKTESSVKSFGADGTSVSLQEDFSLSKKMAGFAPRDVFEGKDMRLLFREFLLLHGKADLLPDDLKQGLPTPRYPTFSY